MLCSANYLWFRQFPPWVSSGCLGGRGRWAWTCTEQKEIGNRGLDAKGGVLDSEKMPWRQRSTRSSSSYLPGCGEPLLPFPYMLVKVPLAAALCWGCCGGLKRKEKGMWVIQSCLVQEELQREAGTRGDQEHLRTGHSSHCCGRGLRAASQEWQRDVTGGLGDCVCPGCTYLTYKSSF